MRTQLEKATAFAALHHQENAFVIPNPWDAGTARLLAHLGFKALATTSAGYAFSLGEPDNTVGLDAMMDHLKVLAAATDLPVSADLEDGFGDDPATVAETIRRAAAAGVVGGSIEDDSQRPGDRIYELELAAERIRAAVAAARSLDFPFTLTARAENYLAGRNDIKDTIKRLQAYQEAGADVLYAPGLTSKEDIAAVISSVDRPVNVVMGIKGARISVGELSKLGVKRISIGSSLSRAALSAFMKAAQEIRDQGTFSYADQAISYREFNDIFKEPR